MPLPTFLALLVGVLAAAGLSIASEPPARLNMEGRWPITDDSLGTSVAVVK